MILLESIFHFSGMLSVSIRGERNLAILFSLLFVFDVCWCQQSVVGRQCAESTECGSGSYCASNRRCSCLSSYVDIDGYCWRKINPGEAGCTENKQCNGVWPGSYCSSGTCRCENNQDPFPTKDGLVCVNYGGCPIGGQDTKLKYSDGNVLNYCLVTSGYGCPSTYDCFCRDAQCTTSVSNFCCPSRAYACGQPYDVGQFPAIGGGTLNRYYHDVVTGECKLFNYRGAKGNANNFMSKEHCESYCTEACDRGRPAYTDEADPSLITKNGLMMSGAKTCDTGSSSTACLLNYECKAIGTKNFCCPTVDSVCSKAGAVIYDNLNPAPTTDYDPGVKPGTTVSTIPRYYYDRTNSRCRPFSFNGQQGNFNNFMSQNDCELFCSRIVCKAGLPLKDSTGVSNLRCGSNSNCPGSHECKTNLCCARPQFVCKLSQAVGSCGSYTTRWWFNAKTGNCEEFTYSGCQGNANNFGEYTDCQSFCKDVRTEPKCLQGKATKDSNGLFIVCGGNTGVTQTCRANQYCYYDGTTYGCCDNQAYTCQSNYNEGRQCGPSVSRWYFDTTTKKCQTFNYKGCDGNSNNFATQSDCNDYCAMGSCPDGGTVYIESSSGNARSCSNDDQCPRSHFCTTVTTDTQFGQNQAQNRCCPSKSYVCSQYKDFGTRCTATTIPRYFFNSDTKSCEEFEFNGCAGNRNNFATRNQCENYCLSSACPSGEMVSFNADSGQLLVCSAVGAQGAAGGCPEDHDCTLSITLGQNVCCGTPAEMKALCPASSRPYVSPITLQARQCTPNIAGACPAGYFCHYAAQSATNSFFCCEEAGTVGSQDICPPQLKPISGGVGQTYRYCSPTGSGTDCGQDNYCQFSDSLNRYVCCGASTQMNKPNICPPQPPGLVPDYGEKGSYRFCEPAARPGTLQACPSGSACLYTGVQSQYICCTNSLKSPSSTKARMSATNFDQPSTPAIVGDQSDCSNEADYRPLSPFPTPCSPFSAAKCEQLAAESGAFTSATCLFSQGQDRFVCCGKTL